MKYFTSDWHFGEDRLGITGKPNLFYRPFKSVEQQNQFIYDSFVDSEFKDGDELWHLGDVAFSLNDETRRYLQMLRNKYPNSRFNLIVGNYDEDNLAELRNYFDTIQDQTSLFIGETNYYLNHYPIKCKTALEVDSTLPVPCYDFAITGHIHGLWKVQKQMVNVGVDAWHFKPVSETMIDFAMNACKKFYDDNVFPY